MNREKFDALVHYICARCEDPTRLGATKLNKVLWFSDTTAHLMFGHSITGATYIKRQFGPVPKEIVASRQRLTNTGAIVERDGSHFGYRQTQFVSIKPPKLSLFTAEEISLVDEIMGIICNEHTATSISRLTHDRIWKIAGIGEELPIYTIFAQEGEITEDDVAWAKDVMKELEPARVSG